MIGTVLSQVIIHLLPTKLELYFDQATGLEDLLGTNPQEKLTKQIIIFRPPARFG